MRDVWCHRPPTRRYRMLLPDMIPAVSAQLVHSLDFRIQTIPIQPLGAQEILPGLVAKSIITCRLGVSRVDGIDGNRLGLK